MKEKEITTENLHKWFKEKWVRFGPDGKIKGDCARGSEGEGKPKCLPQAKAHSLGKKGRASAAARKRREDPNPERSGKAINVATKKKTNEEQIDELKCWPGYHRVKGTKAGFPGSCAKNTNESVMEEKCPHCGGPIFELALMNEKKDACYYKVKSRYKVWPSAYASGALVKCRKKGAKNWGTGGKKNENAEPIQRIRMKDYEEQAEIIHQKMMDALRSNNNELYEKLKQLRLELDARARKGMLPETKGLPYPGTYEQEMVPYKTKAKKRTRMIAFEDKLEEKWSAKYKRSIDCSHPKGFSQRAHCQGRKKNK